MSQPGQSQPSFDTLPGEIRNQIFALCIWHALSHPNADKSNWPDTRPPFSQWHPPPRKWLTAAVYSPSSDTGYLKLSGIGPLPVLLVNKQTYAEVSSLVFALVDSVSIGASMPQYLDENPIQRWMSAYSLVEERPDIHSFHTYDQFSSSWNDAWERCLAERRVDS